jgi:hypothetical protein
MTTAITPKTLYDWYLEEQTTPTAGRLARWQQRTLAMRFDGVRLGDHVLPPSIDEDASKKMWEMDGSARSLVSGDLDRLIRNMTVVPTAPPARTPDFIAALTDGRDIVIEHSRICEKTDMLIAKGLTATQREVSALVAQSALPPRRVAFAFQWAPDHRHAAEAAREMVEAMSKTVKPQGMVREPFGPEYPYLRACGVHWTVVANGVSAEAVVEPWLIETDPQLVADEIYRVIDNKAKRHADYLAYGQAVWLTIWIEVNFYPPAAVLTRLKRMNVERGPFEKIVVGCTTRALVYDDQGAHFHQDF